MEIHELRKQYNKKTLSLKDLKEDPFDQFTDWFGEAQSANVKEPNAMTLATIDAENKPCVRTVLLKAFDSRGFVFYTNFESRKACNIANNPKVALLFPWLDLDRQVEISGVAEKISDEEAYNYFKSRPAGNQMGAWASPQSRVIESRAALDEKIKSIEAQFKDKPVPLPPFWGGYRVKPSYFRFWQGSENRLHDCFQYRQESNSKNTWIIQRLAP